MKEKNYFFIREIVATKLTCGWNVCSEWALCNGISTRLRNNLCSSLSGIAKPFIILPNISSSSAIPLNFSSS